MFLSSLHLQSQSFTVDVFGITFLTLIFLSSTNGKQRYYSYYNENTVVGSDSAHRGHRRYP